MKSDNEVYFKNWTAPEPGVLYVVTGPSGTGKTTLVQAALRQIPRLNFSVSATTRKMREGEENGKDYHFIDEEDFKAAIERGEFLEWAKVYSNYYGTLKSSVKNSLSKGESIIHDIDPQGAEQVRNSDLKATSIFILPPDIETLENRLYNRKTDSDSVIQNRMREVKEQLKTCIHFDYLLVNDDLQSAISQFKSILIAEMLKKNKREKWIQQFSG